MRMPKKVEDRNALMRFAMVLVVITCNHCVGLVILFDMSCLLICFGLIVTQGVS